MSTEMMSWVAVCGAAGSSYILMLQFLLKGVYRTASSRPPALTSCNSKSGYMQPQSQNRGNCAINFLCYAYCGAFLTLSQMCISYNDVLAKLWFHSPLLSLMPTATHCTRELQ